MTGTGWLVAWLRQSAVLRVVSGCAVTGTGRWWAVEVELTLKQPRSRLIKAVHAAWKARRDDTEGLLYVTGDDRIEAGVIAAITALRDDGRIPRKPLLRTRTLTEILRDRHFNPPTTAIPVSPFPSPEGGPLP